MAYRKRRRKAKAHRRRKHSSVYTPKRRYRRRRKSTARRRHRRYANPRRYYAKRRSRRHRRRHNPSGAASLARRSYGTAKSLFSMGMAKNVAAGIAGFVAFNYVEGLIPPIFPTTSYFGNLLKKGIAAVATYMVAGFIPGVSRSMKRYVLYGSALNIGFDLLQDLPQIAPGIASATKMSGYSGYGEMGSLDVPNPPARLMPTALIPGLLQ